MCNDLLLPNTLLSLLHEADRDPDHTITADFCYCRRLPVTVKTKAWWHLLECLYSASGRSRRSDLWTLGSTSHQLHPEQTSWSILRLCRNVALSQLITAKNSAQKKLICGTGFLHRCPLESMSKTRPGVPTTMCGASAWSLCISLRTLVPPMQAWHAAPM